MWRRLGIFVFSSLLSILVAGSTAALAGSPVRYSKSCADAGYKPTQIAITCADAKVIFEATEWIRWDSDRAEAIGELTYPDCPPKVPLYRCAHYAHDEATVKLSRVRYCPQRQHRYFTRLLLLDPQASDPYLKRLSLESRCAYVK